MEENSINIDQHESNEIQPKFNTLNKSKSNQSLFNANDVPLEHLRSYAILRCGSINKFSQRLGVERSMGSKILSGKYIPKKISTIERIADVLGIKAVVLTHIFFNLQNEKA